MISLKNSTSSPSIIGKAVMINPRDKDSFIYAPNGSTRIAGIITESVPPNKPCRIAVQGDKALVLVQGNPVVGSIIRLGKTTDRVSLGVSVIAKQGDAPYLKIGDVISVQNGYVSCVLDLIYISSESTGDFQPLNDNLTRLADYRRIGGDDNYTEFGTDGFITLNGNATAWEDENVGSVSLGVGASAPDLITLGGGGNTIMIRAFDGIATTEQLFGELEIPHKTKFPSNIIFHLHWCPTTNDAGNVKWNLTYVLQNEGETLPVETTISTVVAANGVAWKMQKTNFPSIEVSALGQQLIFRLWRNPGDGSDDYAHDAAISGTIGFHFEVDSIGSNEVTTK